MAHRQTVTAVSAASELPRTSSPANNPLASDFDDLARVAVAADIAEVCIMRWAAAGGSGLAAAPAEFDQLAAPLVAVAERELCGAARSGGGFRRLAPADLRPILNGRSDRYRLSGAVAGIVESGDLKLLLILLGAPALDEQMNARARLIGGYAQRIGAAAAARGAGATWQRVAADIGTELAQTEAHLAALKAETALIENARTTLAQLDPPARLAGLARLVAEAARLDSWSVLISTRERWRLIAGSSAKPEALTAEIETAAAAASASGTIALQRLRGRAASDRGTACALIPFADAVVILWAQAPIEKEMIARLERIQRWLQPLVAVWRVEQEVARLQTLVRTLGVRLYGAIDEERRRIARDLHDDLAQLLTAARIALETDPAAARDVLRQLDDALRTRVRELRPPALGRVNLRETIALELRRLAEAGIETRLTWPPRVRGLNRSVQELCYQILREVFSNILRHAEATRVEIELTKSDGALGLRIDDNGRGFDRR